MKKKIILKIISGAIFTLLFIVLVSKYGVSRPKLENEKSVFKYLKKYYPDETFEIVGKQELVDVSSGNCGEEHTRKGIRWTVKSKESSIEFDVEDKYEFNSIYCSYIVKDDYSEKSFEDFLLKNSNYKFDHIYNYFDGKYSINIYFKKENFTTSSEMVNYAYNIITQLKKTYPFKYVKYKGSNNIVKLFFGHNIYSLDEINDIETLTKIINDLWN